MQHDESDEEYEEYEDDDDDEEYEEYDFIDEVPLFLRIAIPVTILISAVYLAEEGLWTTSGRWAAVVLGVTVAHVLAYTLAYALRKGWNKAEMY
jgi:hypothetical protein